MKIYGWPVGTAARGEIETATLDSIDAGFVRDYFLDCGPPSWGKSNRFETFAEAKRELLARLTRFHRPRPLDVIAAVRELRASQCIEVEYEGCGVGEDTHTVETEAQLQFELDDMKARQAVREALA